MSVEILMQRLRILVVPREGIEPVEPACCWIVVSGPEVLWMLSRWATVSEGEDCDEC